MTEGNDPFGPVTGGPQPTGTDDRSDEGLIQTFLIADVRGYTLFSQEHGDEAAGRLAKRYAQVITEVIEAQGGTVIELTGDEALCVFSTTRRAIRAAIELQTRFVAETMRDPALPLPVGIGIDTGEAVPVGGGFRGRALNTASRLCAVARAGEVLATREAIHMAGSMTGITVEDRGRASFKNMPEPVSVMRVAGDGEDPARWFAARAPTPAPANRTRRRRRIGIAVLATLLIAAVAIPLMNSRGSGSTSIQPNSIGVLDPGSGELIETIGLEDRPGSVAASADAVWVTNPDIGTVTRIDPNEQEVRDSIQVGENPTGIAIGFDAVWVVNSGGPSVSRISPDSSSVVDTIGVGNGPAGVAAGEGYVWVTNRFDGTISRIDPDGGDVKTIPVGLDPRGIAVGFDSVWVALAGSNTLVRLNPQTDAVTPIVVGNGPESLAVSRDAVWVVNTLGNTVSRISPDTNLAVDTIEVGQGPSGIAIVQGAVWVGNEADGTISGIGPGQSPVRTMAVDSVPQGLAGANGDLWVSVNEVATSHRGGTLRVVSADGPSSLDPHVAYDFISLRVPHLLGDGLVAFEPIGGTNATLVPDLATSVPTPTDGGRTYTFALRPGIRYSNGDVVAPADFRRGFERGFHLSNRGVYRYFYGGLIGAETCWKEPRTCDLSRGIVTDDVSGTITFHLEAADSDFLNKLTIAFAYPVPPSTPKEEQVTEGIPGTGPYMPYAPMTDEGLTLVRNPYFRVWSPAAQPDGYADRIEWTFGEKTEAQIEAVAIGDADISFDASYLPSDSLEALFVHYAALVRSSPQALTSFVTLNTQEPPFDNVEVRQALNLAVDRDRVVQIFGGEGTALSTCQHLPPNFPGYEPYCPYTRDPDPSGAWSGADFKRAQELVRRSGTAGMHLTFVFAPRFFGAQGEAFGEYLVELLAKLGYDVNVKAVPADRSYYPGAGFQMALDAWGLDYPSASNFISNRFMCDAAFSTGFCDRKIDAMIDRATQMQAGDPAAAGALWADIDHAIVDEAPYLWLTNSVAVEFVSERVGNYRWSLQWGSLLNQLWVR